MTKSDVRSLVVNPVESITIDYFIDPLGTHITEITSGEPFYAVVHYTIAWATVWVYQTDDTGVPIVPYTRLSGTTSATGRCDVGPFTAPDVATDVTIYFRAYDDAQKPT